jgi:hypothetical protein
MFLPLLGDAKAAGIPAHPETAVGVLATLELISPP